MQQNRILKLIGVLALLLLVAWFTGVFDSAPSTVSVPDVSVDTEQTTRISLESAEWDATLSQEGGLWQVVDPVNDLADSMTVNRLLDSVRDLTLNSVVSTNSARHANYGVAEGEARVLTLEGAGDRFSLAVAEQGPDFSSSYVRLDGDDVFASSRIAWPTSLDQLRDKALARIDPAQVISATVVSPDFTYEVSYGVDGWSMASSGTIMAVDSVAVTSWLRRFAPLRLDGFEDGLTADSVAATHRVTFRQMNGSTVEIVMGIRGDNMVAHTEGSNRVMRSFGSRMESLVEPPEDLQVDS